MARLTIFYFTVLMTFAPGGCTARSLEATFGNRPDSADPDRSSGRWKNLGAVAGLDGSGANIGMNLGDVAPTLRREFAPGQIVSGRVEGLLGAGLVLQLSANDDRDELHVLRDGPIAFPFPIARGAGTFPQSIENLRTSYAPSL